MLDAVHQTPALAVLACCTVAGIETYDAKSAGATLIGVTVAVPDFST